MKNYDNSGKDQIVGMVKWGFTSDGQHVKPINNGEVELIQTDKFSENARKIIESNNPKK